MGDDRDIKVLFSSCQGGPTNTNCFLHVREVQLIFRVWVGDDMDIKVLFSSCQGGPTNIQGVGGG